MAGKAPTTNVTRMSRQKRITLPCSGFIQDSIVPQASLTKAKVQDLGH
jgi:hypothetical protein